MISPDVTGEISLLSELLRVLTPGAILWTSVAHRRSYLLRRQYLLSHPEFFAHSPDPSSVMDLLL